MHQVFGEFTELEIAESLGSDAAAGGDDGRAKAERLLLEPRPLASAEDIDAVLQRGWGVQGTKTLLSGERDHNTLVTDARGARYVLKIYNTRETPEVRAFQHDLFARAEAVTEVALPRLLLGSEGGPEMRLDLAGTEHVAILMTHVQGVDPVIPGGPRFRHALGRATGALGQALAGYDHPAAHREMWWNQMHLGRLKGMVGLVEDPRRRDWLSTHIADFEAEIRPKALQLPSQVIHNDLNPSNIRVDPADPEHVLSLIDFGDATYAPRINELAVACSYFLDDESNIARSLWEMVSGHEVHQRFEDEEIALLPQLICTRLATRLLLTHWRHSRFAHQSDYILRNLANAWRVLDAVTTTDPRSVADELLAIRRQQKGCSR